MKNIPQTLDGALSYWAEKLPKKTFIHSLHNDYSFQKTKTITENIAGFFISHSIVAGDAICLLIPRIPELIFSFLAACRTRCIPAPINYLESPDNIKKNILSVNPSVIIVDDTLVSDELKSFILDLNILTISTHNTTNPSGFIPWKDCVQQSDQPVTESSIKPDDLAYYNFTTGSTGFPKATKCTHANIFWNTSSTIHTFQLTSNDIHLCMFAAFAHPHELFCRALYTGGSIVLLTEINPKVIVQVINRFQVTCMMGLAVMYKMMAKHCANESVSSLRIVESGGMITDPETHKQFFNAFNLPILSVWGSTETSGVALANTLLNHRVDGSMGKACPHYQVKILLENGTEAQTDEVGELLFSGPGVVSGYDKNISFPSKNEWYCSGDLALKDKDDFYYFIERKSGMIKVAGLKVYPLQVELFLQRHPHIEEVAVIGIKEKRRGYVPKAYIVAKSGHTLDIEDIFSFCKNKLAAYMIPKYMQQLEALPKIGSGKINKKELIALEK